MELGPIMGFSTLSLYVLTVFIWGSTWLAITFQLGVVNPVASVIYRFSLATVLLWAWCLIKRKSLVLRRREHALLVIQGSCLFAFNYWLMYLSAQHLTSGLIAVIFSLIVFFNVLNGRLFLGMTIRLNVVLGSLLGIAGVTLLFYPEMTAFSPSDDTVAGLVLAIAATYVASLGNIVATHNSASGKSVLVINAWGMFYGTLVLIVVALFLGVDFQLDTRVSYLTSLLYLSVFGSIVTFTGYLKLLTLIGPDKAGYIGMMVPVIALVLSSVFEDYRWTGPGIAGLVLILAGNWQVMRK